MSKVNFVRFLNECLGLIQPARVRHVRYGLKNNTVLNRQADGGSGLAGNHVEPVSRRNLEDFRHVAGIVGGPLLDLNEEVLDAGGLGENQVAAPLTEDLRSVDRPARDDDP